MWIHFGRFVDAPVAQEPIQSAERLVVIAPISPEGECGTLLRVRMKERKGVRLGTRQCSLPFTGRSNQSDQSRDECQCGAHAKNRRGTTRSFRRNSHSSSCRTTGCAAARPQKVRGSR